MNLARTPAEITTGRASNPSQRALKRSPACRECAIFATQVQKNPPVISLECSPVDNGDAEPMIGEPLEGHSKEEEKLAGRMCVRTSIYLHLTIIVWSIRLYSQIRCVQQQPLLKCVMRLYADDALLLIFRRNHLAGSHQG